MANKKPEVEFSNMSEDMRLHAIQFVIGQDKKIIDQDPGKVAKDLKKQFDEKFHPTWQCIAGKDYSFTFCR